MDKIPNLKVYYVREVAPNKEMFRVTFPLKLNFVLKTNLDEEPSAKKQKISDTVE